MQFFTQALLAKKRNSYKSPRNKNPQRHANSHVLTQKLPMLLTFMSVHFLHIIIMIFFVIRVFHAFNRSDRALDFLFFEA
jgi:hypothetical protein